MNMDDSIIRCKGCPKSFKTLTILKHLSHVKKCKQSYSEKELNDMSVTSKKLTAIKKRDKKLQNYTTTKRQEIYQKNKDKIALKYTFRKKEQEEKGICADDKQTNKEKCKVCLRYFKDTSILNHIAKSNLCRKLYNSESFQKEMDRLGKLSSDRNEIKVANWNKEHQHERFKYYNPRKRAERYVNDRRKISAEYQKHKAYMKHKIRKKKVAEKYHQKKMKWASKEGKAFSVASKQVFENIWNDIYDEHFDEALEKVHDDKDLHSKAFDIAMESTFRGGGIVIFSRKYQNCDGFIKFDCEKAYNPLNKPCICKLTESEIDVIHESSMEEAYKEAYKEAFDIEEGKAAKTIFNKKWKGPLENALEEARQKFVNKGFNKFFDGLFQIVYNDAYDRALDELINSEKLWREDKEGSLGSLDLIYDMESDHVFATHEELKKFCCQEGEFTKQYSDLIFSLIDKEYGLEMLHRRKRFNKDALNLHLSFKEEARKTFKKLKNVNFTKDKGQEIELAKKQAQNLSKELDNKIDNAVETGNRLEDDFQEVSKLYDELMKVINSQWDEMNKKVSIFTKDKAFIDKFPPYARPGEPCNCIMCIGKTHKITWPFCTRIEKQKELQREDLTCPNCFKDIAKNLMESHIDNCDN